MLQLLPRLFQPHEMVIKRGSLMRLQYLAGKRVALITGSESLKRTGGLDKIKSFLEKGKMEFTLIDGITGDPSIDTVKTVAQKLIDYSPDWIVAVGGGAVMDCAKLARVFYEKPEINFEDIQKPFSIPELPGLSKLALIPTTAGSGSEVSHVSVVTDSNSGNKIPLVSECFVADLVILDATLTVNLSPQVTAYTALDAFTHAIESYCSRAGNLFSESYALKAGRLITRNLLTVVAEPRNINGRENLLYASMFAGMAQNLTSVGAVHALSHVVGARTGMPHGHANAVFLPPVVLFNSEGSTRPAKFVVEVGFNELVELFEWVYGVLDTAKLARTWREATEGEFDTDIMAEDILKDVCMRTNPVKMEKGDILEILNASTIPG